MSTRQVLVYASARFLLWLVVVFGSAHTIKALGETFHSRHTYRQAFVVAAYGLGPMFLLQLLQVFPMHPAVPWSIGIVLAFSILYHGVPKVMEPDPSHAFGLYLTTGILLALTSAAAVIALYCLAAWVLRQSFI